MKSPQSIVVVLITTLLSVVLVLGSFQMSFVEGHTTPVQPSPTLLITTAEPSGLMTTPTVPPSVHVITITATPNPTPTPVNTLAVCPPPQNWVPYSIQIADSLEKLAENYNLSVPAIKQANCLETDSLIPGSFIYLPAITATPTQTRMPTTITTLQCGPPASWVVYIIQREDTLFGLSILFGVSVPELQKANCMGNSTFLQTGTRFFVPFYLTTNEPTPTASNTPVPATIPTNTATLAISTTALVVPALSATPSFTPTLTSNLPTVPVNTAVTPSLPVISSTSILPTLAITGTPNANNTPTLIPTYK